ncbi:MAG TPA: chemoreceptor glutamine deamidase CheD [Pseudomonadales bacterium]|nr:chemoreceptor glutamine deamidase CheD [Pseudomonadales bacterium]
MNALHQPTSPMPPTERQFQRVNRFWDPKNRTWAAKIGPGEFYTSNHNEMISTVLGSCVAACIRLPVAGIGGMNHFMLPTSRQDVEFKLIAAGARYGAVAMERLINSLLQYGGRRQDLEVKLFGGAKVLDIDSAVGERNVEFAMEFVKSEGLKLLAVDMGGMAARKVQYYPGTGVARVRFIVPRNPTVLRRERNYRLHVDTLSVTSEVTIFEADEP